MTSEFLTYVYFKFELPGASRDSSVWIPFAGKTYSQLTALGAVCRTKKTYSSLASFIEINVIWINELLIRFF